MPHGWTGSCRRGRSTRVGERYLYSDVGLITAGRVAEIAGGASLDALLRARVTGPLGLPDTGYLPAESLRSRAVATEDKPERPGPGCVRGEVHDETAYGLGGVAGHAGVFSTADDLVRFTEVIRTGGAPILSPDTTAEMTRDQGVRGADFRHGLGVRIGDPAIVGPLADAYGHSGFTGTSLVVDPDAPSRSSCRPTTSTRSAVARASATSATPWPPRP